MAVIAHDDIFTIEIAEWGVLSATVDQPALLSKLGKQTPNASLDVECRIPLAGVPHDLDQRYYQIAFTLGAPYHNPEQLGIMSFGDSLLRMERSVPCRIIVGRQGEDDDMPVVMIPNEHRRLSRLVVFVQQRHTAKSAESCAYAAVGPTLSQLSAIYGVPLHTVLVERFLFEPPGTLHYGRTVIVPYEVKDMDLDQIIPQQPLVGLHSYERAISHYREGLVSVSPLHRFLSWFKAIEAVEMLRQELMKKNPSLQFRRTVVSDTPDIRFKFSHLIGQPHTKIINPHLRKPFRNSVAHWGDGDRTDLSHDHRHGVLMYNLLCHLAEDVFRGMFSATVEAVQGKR